MSGQTAIRIEQLGKRFGAGPLVLDDVNLSIETGEFVCLLGASGCGKSTLLNLIAGLDRPTTGSIDVPAEGAAVMFQESALFPWLTVEENVAFPLQMQGVGRSERKQRVAELLAMVHLEKFARRRPHELSGGMKQRVALARALAQRASLLLMDEPFAALDAMSREHMMVELQRIWMNTGTSVLFITHSIQEAVFLADRVVTLSGRPGQVIDELATELPRPRTPATLADPGFVEKCAYLRSLFHTA